jgi:hypothetical protein
VRGQGIETLEADKPAEDERLAPLRGRGRLRWGDRPDGGAQACSQSNSFWAQHRSYRFINLCRAQPNENALVACL